MADGFRVAMIVTAGLSALGGLLAFATIRADVLEDPGPGCEDDLGHAATDPSCALAGHPAAARARARAGTRFLKGS